MIGISASLIWSKILMELIFNHCDEFRWSGGPSYPNPSPHLHAGAPGILSDLLRSVQMLKREWGVESNGKLPHVSIPSKTAVCVPEFAVEDLPLSRTEACLGSWVYSEWPALGQNTLLQWCPNSAKEGLVYFPLSTFCVLQSTLPLSESLLCIALVAC